jgi:hypothetical protein
MMPDPPARHPGAAVIGEDERRALWERHLAPLRCPAMCQKGMSGADEQTLRDIALRVMLLLKWEAVLPAGLVAMLSGYRLELAGRPGGRWEGAGDPSRALHLAERLGQAFAEGRWKPGQRVYDEHYDYRLAEPHPVLHRALQVLAVRGEVAIQPDGYYVRGRDASPR